MLPMKKGRRPPPNGGVPGMHEPPMPGWSQTAFDQSESGRSVRKNLELRVRFSDEMDPGVLRYWAERGVKKELFDAGKNDDRNKYSVFTPIEIRENEKLPVLYYSHGDGGDPYGAELIGFTKLIPNERFIAVYPQNGGPSNDDAITEFPRIMGVIRSMGYPVDWSRIYASGYSSGSDATESIGTTWPEMVAAVAPCPGSNAMYNSLCRYGVEAYRKCLTLHMPYCAVGGTADYGDRYPFPDEECFQNFNIWMQKIVKVRGYRPLTMMESQRLVAETEDPVVRAMGIPFARTWTEHFEGRDWYFGAFDDDMGRPAVRMVLGRDVPHVATGCHAALVWDFLKHWSRDPESGESIYTPVVIGGVN